MKKKMFSSNRNDPTPKESGGLDVTGKNEMLFIGNRFQKKLDIAFSDIRNRIWKLERDQETSYEVRIMLKN